MVWCLDNADCAVQIARLLVDGVLEDGLTLTQRIHRLFFISDVVLNSGSATASSAWCYRREFELHLPAVFERMRGFYCHEMIYLPGERAATQVLKVLEAWQNHAVFSAQYLKGLETSFFKDFVSVDAVVPRSGARPAASVHLPEAIFVKLAEWRSQHFSQLEKIAKARGLNWNTQDVEKPANGRSIEDEKKIWLLDRLLTYEIYVWETRLRDVKKPSRPEVTVHVDKSLMLLGGTSAKPWEQLRATADVAPAEEDLDGAALEGEDLDGESLSSSDEAFLPAEVLASSSSRSYASSMKVCDGVEEDVDGVPVTFALPDDIERMLEGFGAADAVGRGRGSANGTAAMPGEDDDLDGVPMRVEDLSMFAPVPSSVPPCD